MLTAFLFCNFLILGVYSLKRKQGSIFSNFIVNSPKRKAYLNGALVQMLK